MGNALSGALDFIQRGFYLFPIQANGKVPFRGFAWKELSSNDIEQIQSWGKEFPGCNWACDCGKSGLTVIDLDISEGINGVHNYLERFGDEKFSKTLEVGTPSGGIHMYFLGESKTSASKVAPGVDTRSTGGYVLTPGSSIHGKSYQVIADMDLIPKISPLPALLAENIGKERTKNQTRVSEIELDQPNNIADAVTYLQSAPPSIEGCGGDENAYRVACRTRDLGISEVTALELMLRLWNDRCQPVWSFEELQKKISNAYQYAISSEGNKTAEGQFSAVVTSPVDILGDDRPKKLSDSTGRPAERDWIVEDWLPAGEISSLYGDGGVGKSLLALQLGMAVASGGQFCGVKVSKPMPVLAVMAEDSDDELHRRLHDIRGIPEYALSNDDIPFYLWSRAGKDALMASISVADAKITITEFGNKLDAQLSEMGEEPKLLILDTLADIFGGNENDRQCVNRFVKVVLGGIAKEHNATILMLAHPSKTSISDGSYYSGSTAWSNAVRNRLVLKPHDLEDLKDMRILERVKSNYARIGETITLQWERGAFKVVENDSEVVDELQSQDAQIVYNAIRDQANFGTPLSMRANAVNPIIHSGLKNNNGQLFKFNDFKRIVGRLQGEGRVSNVGGQRTGNGLWPTEELREHEELGLFKPVRAKPKPKKEKRDFSWL